MVKRYLRIAALLPLATWRYLKKRVPALLLLGVPVLLLLVILLIALRGWGKEPERVPEIAAPSIAPTVTPTPAPPVRQVTLSFAGDCTLGMDEALGYNGSFNEMYDMEGPAYFLQNVRDIFLSDDLTVVNFEGALTEAENAEDKSWTFKGEKEYAGVLTLGGVEAANLANNHSHDFGETGFSDTAAALDAAGILPFGYDETAIVEAGGVKVGLSGQFTVYEDPRHLEDLENNIRALREQGAELIIACFHWGLENDDTPDADQIELAHAAIDAGAHLVIGHHPHVLQGVEVYKGRYIVYSLGNFSFGGNYSPPDYDCMIFRQTFSLQVDQVLADDRIQVIPCSISSAYGFNNFQPEPAEGAEKTRILGKLRDLSAGLGERNIFEE